MALALAICIGTILTNGLAARWLIASTLVVLISFNISRLFTDKAHIVTTNMHYTVNGKTPWNEGTRQDRNGHPPVLIYARTADGSYCYDEIFYEPLRQRLIATHPSTVQVQYTLFYDFGHERAYNVRSIAGIPLSDGYKPLIPDFDSDGGTVETTNPHDTTADLASCPR